MYSTTRSMSVNSLSALAEVGFFPAVSPAIGKTFALDTFQGFESPFCIADLAIVIPEIELAKVAFQVLGRYMLVSTIQTTLED